MTIRSILLTMFFVALSVGAALADMAEVRVAILPEASHFTLTIDGRYEVVDQASKARLGTGVRLRPALVEVRSGSLYIGETAYTQPRIAIEPRTDAMVSVNNKHYRGHIIIIRNTDKSLTVINSIGIEEYVRGVLYHEISDKWPMEAIKAQAVATRTYAAHSTQQYAKRDYDMTSDIYSQVYGGRSAERYRTNLAVRQTKGEVLTFNGKVFPAFFHANSGGVTEDARELWDIDITPLRGNVKSSYSIGAPHYKWKQNFRLKDIQKKLENKGIKLGEILDIKVMETNPSGRVRKLKITDRNGVSKVVDGKKFRDVMGPNILRSNTYTVIMKGWYVDFEGHGWGHGVGMCQWGAYNMAKQRISYKRILSFYYPASEVTTLSVLEQ